MVTIRITVEGGLVQSIESTDPKHTEVIIVDFDTDGADIEGDDSVYEDEKGYTYYFSKPVAEEFNKEAIAGLELRRPGQSQTSETGDAQEATNDVPGDVR